MIGDHEPTKAYGLRIDPRPLTAERVRSLGLDPAHLIRQVAAGKMTPADVDELVARREAIKAAKARRSDKAKARRRKATAAARRQRRRQ